MTTPLLFTCWNECFFHVRYHPTPMPHPSWEFYNQLIKHTGYLNVTNQPLISGLQEHLTMCMVTFRSPLNWTLKWHFSFFQSIKPFSSCSISKVVWNVKPPPIRFLLLLPMPPTVLFSLSQGQDIPCVCLSRWWEKEDTILQGWDLWSRDHSCSWTWHIRGDIRKRGKAEDWRKIPKSTPGRG